MRQVIRSGEKLSPRREGLGGASLAALTAALLSAGAAHAQDAAPGDEVQEVVVTGSRIVRSTFTTPTPVTVIGEQDIERLNLSNVNEVITQLPQNTMVLGAANQGGSTVSIGIQVANLRGLNPYFGTRTLTLMNGQRVVPTTAGGGIDTTLIPSMLVGRVETVTGGASAIYGSDAVAGVVNVILDTRLEGFKGQVDYGQTRYGDGRGYHVSGAYGRGFASERGHFTIGAEFENAQTVGICSQVRDWCATNYALFTNVDYNTPGAPGYGQPRYIVGPDRKFAANTSLTGVLTPVTPAAVPGRWLAPIGQMQFDQSGSALVPFRAGAYASGGAQQGGDPNSPGAFDTRNIRPEVRKYTALAHVDYDLTDRIRGSLDGWYAHTLGSTYPSGGANGPQPTQIADFPTNTFLLNFPVTSYNAYLTPAQQAYVNSLGTGLANFGRDIINEVLARAKTASRTWRVAGALKGDLGGSWGWDAYSQYGKTKMHQLTSNATVSPFLTYALDAVRNNAGQIVCGVTIPGQVNPVTRAPYTAADVALASLNGGCRPINLFGVGKVSDAARAYVYPTLFEDAVLGEAVVAATIHGDLHPGWGAGAIKFAAGAEYRHDFVDVTHRLNEQPWYKSYAVAYGLDFKGTIDVIEGYGELNVPLIKDAPFAKYVEVDGAFRATHNKAQNDTVLPPAFAADAPAQAGQSKSRDFSTWKVSGVWDVTDWLRFRATRSRDVRAPQFRELFQVYARPAAGPFSSVNNPWQGGVPQQTSITSGGSLNVKPETADTWTAGVVLQPRSGILNRFRVSADWYQIAIKDPIIGPPGGIGAQNIVTGCFAGSTVLCSLVTRDAANTILAVDNGSANLGLYTTRGVDLEVAYDLPLETVNSGWGGNLNFRVLGSYVYDMVIDTGRGDLVLDYAGQSGPFAAFAFEPGPYWQANSIMTYANGPFSGSVQVRYVGPGRFATITPAGGKPVAPGDPGYATTNPNSINTNRLPSAVYVNLSSSYALNDNLTVFGNVNNLFNKAPPDAPGGTGYPTNPVFFDTLGTTFKVGLRLRY